MTACALFAFFMLTLPRSSKGYPIEHSCAVLSGGTVKCWGLNGSGELGDGTTINRLTPVGVVGLDSGVLLVTGGGSHNCAVLSGGTAKCWGSNGGKLGDGTTINRLTPVGVVGLDSGVVSISAGWAHSCAVLSAGVAKCWGSNSNGQLGDGTTNDQRTPVGVVGLASGVVSIAAGTKYSCAVLSGGTAKCWGENYSGQLGDSTTTARLTPVDVVGLGSGAVSIAVGDGHSCALLIGGAVKCWGSNWRGRVMLLVFFLYIIMNLIMCFFSAW
jgi:alpha-tubulin suppressor-like RCC1 family protein